MRGSIRDLFGIGSRKRPLNREPETSREPQFNAISAASPDPALAPDHKDAYQQELIEGGIDKQIAKSETPGWMRHTFGEVAPEYRLPIGLFGMILVAIIVLSIVNVGGTVVSQLLDLLKAVLGGVIGGAIVKRAVR
jgi:hypothetical protein